MQRLALITGGGRGIGAAIRTVLEQRGCRVMAPTREELDLSLPGSIDTYIKAHGSQPVDILVNNAGINILNPIQAIDIDTWQSMVQTNLTAALRLIQAYAPGMATRGWGRILSVSSIFSVVTREQRAAYSMTKAALNALTRSTAVEFGQAGILANALAPGYVDTDLTRQNNTPEMIARIQAGIPLRRLAQPAELARAAAFLVSEENTYITGQTILVDGGLTCQ
jgi:3-oxoacyl-[acyl-carrier protein] reductase